MKFRDPKTGEVFDTIQKAEKEHCEGNDCEGCDLSCYWHTERHPADAARLMGYEVIEDNCLESEAIKGAEIDPVKEVNMEKKDKPRLAEVLGVDVGEKFRVHPCSCYFWIRPDGDPTSDKPGLEKVQELGWILNAINHPESIIRGPRLTEAELAICKAVGAKWVSREACGADAWDVILWRELPPPDLCTKGSPILARVDYSKFPSVHLGDCICVEDVDR